MSVSILSLFYLSSYFPSLPHLNLRLLSPELCEDEYFSRSFPARAKDFYGYKGRTDGLTTGWLVILLWWNCLLVCGVGKQI